VRQPIPVEGYLVQKKRRTYGDILNMKPVFTSVADQIPKLLRNLANDLRLDAFYDQGQRRPYRHIKYYQTKLQTRQSQPATTVQPSFHLFPSIAFNL
jgi:hypothetical protein